MKIAVQYFVIVLLCVINAYLVFVLFSPKSFCPKSVCAEAGRDTVQYDKLKSKNICKFIGFPIPNDRGLVEYIECEPLFEGLKARYF